ncbi:SAV_915 family protein [Sphaerisporangium sp. NPDC049002]|uniref:SAV_915 family protein n=1 Tax=Sphaerisporangium sp. NPDC049002 TaxID=3155392 RepID=UPI0033F54991
MSDPLLVVPVREGEATVSLRLFRTAAGQRTAVAFTSPPVLARVLGAGQRWIRLSEPALRHMLADLGVAAIVVDPAGAAPPRRERRYEAHDLRVA